MIAGDFNIELLKDNKLKREFLSIVSSFNLNQTIFKYTRVSDHGASCIDNIFTNGKVVKTSVFENFVSDHKAQKIVFEVTANNDRSVTYSRFFTDESKANFLQNLNK